MWMYVDIRGCARICVDMCKTRRHMFRYVDICGYTLIYVEIRRYVQGETYRATGREEEEEVRSMQCVCVLRICACVGAGAREYT